MEENFKVVSGYSKYSDGSVVHYTHGLMDIGYTLEVASKLGFDQRQVLQVRSAVKKFEETMENLIAERLDQLTDLQPSDVQSQDKGSLRRKGQLTQKPPQPKEKT
jgi:hypothetical protein